MKPDSTNVYIHPKKQVLKITLEKAVHGSSNSSSSSSRSNILSKAKRFKNL